MTRATTASAEPDHFTRLPLLARDFYERDPITVARALLGSVLVRRLNGRGGILAGRIVETEAYVREYQGERDRAAHADRGLTPRTRVLFGPGGHAYVYLIYGIHYCLNVSAEPAGQPGCVLIRALEPLAGLAAMQRRRPAEPRLHRLCSGPGNLTRALAISLAENGLDLTLPSSPLSLRAAPPPDAITASGRIGIRHGADWPLRFYLTENTSVSTFP